MRWGVCACVWEESFEGGGEVGGGGVVERGEGTDGDQGREMGGGGGYAR